MHFLTLTGIQYATTSKNCDLIVKSCDFQNAFETDNPVDWLVQSRTCFDGILNREPALYDRLN